MADLVSMKRPPRPRDEMKTAEVPAMIEEERWPYGLRITLEKEELGKLGDQVDHLALGAHVRLTCVAKVESLSASENARRGDSHASAELQIRSLAITGAAPKGGTLKQFKQILKGSHNPGNPCPSRKY